MKYDPIAYIYEAGHHCPACAFKRFGRDEHGTVPEDALDGEGNTVGALAPWDEWMQFDGERETLGCEDCGTVLDTYDPERER